MNSLLRLAFLGLFGVVGIGAAIYVALTSETPPSNATSAKARPTSHPALSADGRRSRRLAYPLEPPAASVQRGNSDETRQASDRPSESPAGSPPSASPIEPRPFPAVAQNKAALKPSLRMPLVTFVSASEEAPSGSPPPAPLPPEAEAPAAEPPAATTPGNDPAPVAALPKSKNTITPLPNRGAGDNRVSVNIQDADIREVLELVSEQGKLNILAGKSVQGKVSAVLNDVDIDTALRAILKSTGFVARREGSFIYVGTAQDFEDSERAVDQINTRVYRPNYVKAADLQALVTPLLTPKSGSVSVTAAAQVGIASDPDKVGGDTFGGGETVLVRDYEAVLVQIDQIIEEIDQRPMQVAIEAMILSVTLNDENQFGIDFQLLRNKNDVRFGMGSPLSDLAQVKFDTGGLKFGFLDSSLGVFLNALETIGDTNVIATPRLMCLNKQRAEILIGSELGYVSTTLTETSSSQKVEFLEVGAQLRLRPFISTDGLIRMEVHPELSTGAVTVDQGFTLPNKETTQVTTNIMVRDGCTVIIGGLMREDLKTTSTQVPLFGSLPVVGALFRQKDESTERKEIVVLITPHIVYEPGTCQEGDKAGMEFHRRQAVYADNMSPIGKRFLGRKYFRLAQQAWNAGRAEAATKFVDLAVHFDPLNRAAIDLQSDLWAGRRDGEHSRANPADAQAPVRGAGANPLDSPEIAPWLLEDLEQPSSPQAAPADRGGAGAPGSRRTLEKPRSSR
ncbi:MAG: secretin and TonB N-terminal domain-containing protein [Pirellulales bacterium]